MEKWKARYETPELEELRMNAFAVIAGSSSLEELIQGDVDEEEL